MLIKKFIDYEFSEFCPPSYEKGYLELSNNSKQLYHFIGNLPLNEYEMSLIDIIKIEPSMQCSLSQEQIIDSFIEMLEGGFLKKIK